jgi:two-component system NarL family response regulator
MLIIASTSSQRVAHWKNGLQGHHAILEVADMALLKSCLTTYTPKLLLLDLEFPGLGGAATFRKLRQHSPSTKIIVLGQPLSDEVEISFFSTGVRGCCNGDIEPETLQRVITAVRQGEPWIRRSLVQKLLDEMQSMLVSKILEPSSGGRQVAELSPREHQIAHLVMYGESNKLIARRLEITERTVKGHMTDIFRKLGIEDRLKLALMMNTDAS